MRGAPFGGTPRQNKSVADHRPGMPKVAWRLPRRMASCAQHDGGSRSAPRHWSRTTSVRRPPVDPTRNVPHLGQRASSHSATVLQRARDVVAHHARQHQRLALGQLAKELHVHVRTLKAAVRTGRLEAHFTVRSAFGRPIRFATRAAGERFMAIHYRRLRDSHRVQRLCQWCQTTTMSGCAPSAGGYE
jgi:hypothetical protein